MPSESNHAKIFKLGDFECHILSDGSRSVGAMTDGPAERFVFGDAPEEELSRCLSNYGELSASTVFPFN